MEIIKINKKEKEVEFDVSLAKKEWKDAQEKAIKALTKTVKIPGFRPGAAPIAMIRSRLDPGAIIQKAINGLGSSVVTFVVESKQFEESDSLEQIISQNVTKVTLDELEVKVVFEALPKVDNFDLTKITIEPFVDENDYKALVLEQIEKTVKNDIMVVSKENKTIANNDLAIINFKGFIDGVAFENGEAKNYELKIGSKSFIGDFEQQLIGKKINDEFSINVKFPKDYFKKELADKMAKFDVKINDIKQVTYPVINQEYLKKIGIENFKSKAELEAYFDKMLRKQVRNNFVEKATGEINDQIVKVTKISYYPQSLINEFKNKITQQYMKKASDSNLTFDQFLKQNKISKNDFEKNVEINAQNNLIIALVYEQLMNKLKIELNDKDVKEYLSDLTLYFNSELKAKEAYESNKDYSDTFILKNKLIDEVIDIASKNNKNHSKTPINK